MIVGKRAWARVAWLACLCSSCGSPPGAKHPVSAGQPSTDASNTASADQPGTGCGCVSPHVGPKAIAAGDNHTCALTPTGGVKCWGSNDSGQLGDGTKEKRLVATQVSGISSGVVAVSAGLQHSCALKSHGGVLCWGKLGDLEELTPTPVRGLESGVVAISSGRFLACVLMSAGEVRCWGDNDRLQQGRDGTDPNVPSMVPLPLGGAIALSTGRHGACAILATSGVECWGQLRAIPELVSGPRGASKNSADLVVVSTNGYDETCAITLAGGLKCGKTEFLDLSPVEELASDVVSVSRGFRHACAIKLGGALFCWGRNDYGEVGDGTAETRERPTPVAGLANGVVAVSLGMQHTCAMASDGKVWCWGDNRKGELGGCEDPFSLVPQPVRGFP